MMQFRTAQAQEAAAAFMTLALLIFVITLSCAEITQSVRAEQAQQSSTFKTYYQGAAPALHSGHSSQWELADWISRDACQ